MSAKRTYLACLVLALATALLYWPALHFDFILYDDPAYVRDNYHIYNGFSWAGLKWCFTAVYACNWHPLTWISHMLDCQIYKFNTGGHHATNVLLHVFNSTLLFLLLQRMTKSFWPSFVAAALFAWHPLHVESVAWISERKDVLSTFFFLLTLLAFVRYVGATPLSLRSRVSYALSLFFFALALMSKPMVVTLPCVLLLLDFWPLGRFAAPTPGLRRLLLEKIPFFMLSAVSCLITLFAQGRGGAILSVENMSLEARLIHPFLAYWQYIEKAIWPSHLNFFYPYERHWTFWGVIGPFLIILGLTLFAFSQRKARPFWLVGWLWFLGTLVPVIGVIQVGAQAIADRYTYIPLIGLFIIVCWEVYEDVKEIPSHRMAAGLVAVGILGACLALTEKQLSYWKDGGTLFAHGVQADPGNYVAHVNYALYLRNNKQLKQAQKECETALQIAPAYSWGYLYLGDILFLQDKFDEAEKSLRRALEINPVLPEARLLLGQILIERNQPVAAAEQFSTSIKQDPDVPDSYCWLGRALAAQGKLDEAVIEFRTALRMVAEYPEAHYQLALALFQQKKSNEAAVHYREAIRFKPNFPDALNNLAWLLAADSDPKNRNGAEAIPLAERACALTHYQQAMLIGTLAVAYAEAGHFPEAVAAAEKARDTALAHGDRELAAKNIEILNLYRSGRAYHEP